MSSRTMPISTGEVLSHKKYGEAYHSLTIVAPDVGAKVRPGQFVNVRCGEHRDHILRRPFSVYRVHKRGGWASTIELVFDIRGPGTEYLASLRGHFIVDLVGPLGRGFALPKRRAHCLLVGGGIGATPLFFLADELRNEGHRVDVILGARNTGLLLNAIEARRLASVCRTTTEDGSSGDRGRVTDILGETIEKCDTEVVYSCGPHPMLAAVSRVCVERKVPVQVAVEELMGCGYGVCMTCVMPLRRRRKTAKAVGVGGEQEEDDVYYARSCTEGPVFNGASVVWNGAADAVAPDQSELTPAGAPSRGAAALSAEDEHAPPGN
ncbi:MAG: dihydroorotate dehydrogenase electron transfer subunit [Actinomycetota bacterium]|nr:dihydroorotate dehydrogenase electron transfer subunit [Actinomycetota bacterium]